MSPLNRFRSFLSPTRLFLQRSVSHETGRISTGWSPSGLLMISRFLDVLLLLLCFTTSPHHFLLLLQNVSYQIHIWFYIESNQRVCTYFHIPRSYSCDTHLWTWQPLSLKWFPQRVARYCGRTDSRLLFPLNPAINPLLRKWLLELAAIWTLRKITLFYYFFQCFSNVEKLHPSRLKYAFVLSSDLVSRKLLVLLTKFSF